VKNREIRVSLTARGPSAAGRLVMKRDRKPSTYA
jgi:hypothetical protein